MRIVCVCLFVLFRKEHLASGHETCTNEMFEDDYAALTACRAQFALQSNWFPSPIAGLYSYLVWNGYVGFWQNGLILETMVNFAAYAKHRRYISVVTSSQRQLKSLLEAYGPYPSFDDIGWFGLSYSRIYEVLGIRKFLDTSKDIFIWVWKTGWDHEGHCGGGFWFDNEFRSKQTITNLIYFQLAGRLFRLTKDPYYLERLNLIYHYISMNKLVNETTYLINDGATSNCGPNQYYGPSYLSGTMIGGLVEMYKVLRKRSLLDLAVKIADAIIAYSTSKTGIFTEYCEPNCNRDQIVFKGIFVRNLRYLLDSLEYLNPELYQQYKVWLDFNVNATKKNTVCDKQPIIECKMTFRDGPPYYNTSGPLFGPDWSGPFTFGAPEQQTAAFDLFVAAIKPKTKCSGVNCNFDPHFPSPHPLTCVDQPCPLGEECCEYNSVPFISYSCCSRDQSCSKHGICI